MIASDLACHSGARPGCTASLYQQVALRLVDLIEHGTLRPGERVPSVRNCSRQQGVSIATILQAYRLLEDRGLIEARPQSGYYVRARFRLPPREPEMTKPAARAVDVSVSELVMEVIRAARNPHLLRLGATLPPIEIFPLRELNRAMAAVGRRAPLAVNSYESTQGHEALRVQLARRAMEAGCTLAPDDIIITVGATEALNLCLRAVAKPGDVIGIESPTFFGILQIIESLGMRVCEIPTYPREGICLDELAHRIKAFDIKACVFTPNFSNPLGSCMPDEKKRELVRLLSTREIPLIEDDIYGNLAFGTTRPKVAKAFDREGWVMLCDSFTKSLSPGARVGWVAPGRFRVRVEFLKFVNTSASPSLPQMAIAEFLRNGGYDHHLRRIRRFFAKQMQLMSDAVSQHFPPGTRITRPAGGMCLWVELPEEVNALAVYRQALAAGIGIAPGPIFSAKQQFRNFIRLNCGNPWSDQIESAVRTLGRIIASPISTKERVQTIPGPAASPRMPQLTPG